MAEALKEGEDYYVDKESGLVVFTEKYHLKRGYCCKSGCRHCPWKYKQQNDLNNRSQKPAQ